MAAAIPAAPLRPLAPYENWRPPVIGVSLLVPVGSGSLLVPETLGAIALPIDAVHHGETPWQAAQHVLFGAPHGIPVRRHVLVASKQMRRRKVITHVLATARLSPETVASLTYRDPRAELRIMPTDRVIERLHPEGRLRVLLALQSLAFAGTANVEDGPVRDNPPSCRGQ